MPKQGPVDIIDVHHMGGGNNSVGGDDELRMAARAGLILLEKNAALEVNVELLSTELRRYEVQHRELQMEVQSLRDQHKAAVLEVQAAHKEVKVLQSSHRKERAAWHSSEEASQQQLRSLASELRAQQQLHQNSSSTTPLPHESQNNADFAKPSSSDDDPLSEDPRVTLLQTENDLLQTHLSQVLLELSQLQVTWSQSSYASNQRIQALEHDLHKLTRENKLLKDEQAEERELIDSLRTICHTYKKIADARPFAASTCLDENNQECHDTDQGESLGSSSSEATDAVESSMHEDVMHMNTALERRVRELEALVATSTSTVSEEHAVYMEEQLMGTREALKHTKQQWVAAVAAKKEALACTAAAHEELARMQEVFESMQKGATKQHDEDEHVDWMDDTVVHPAPPGDLDSPLIGCLLQHWTSDTERWAVLLRWLQSAIHGRPTHGSVRLDRLSSEVSAGFVQLLVPVLREEHGVHVKVRRRTSSHVLTDLVLSVEANQPIEGGLPGEVGSCSSSVLHLVS
ncbi:hypothetical protein H257_08301 [Aphanomyces astaci]|uniref:Uncharacterized protein n=1 Tax=Aphanomyces astaci TaxID=112090 RepID=W4GEL4_APHAT|nr:hypothetical protein H257_08301 [Aphanomyces astaci]ETV78095.1 hypothetical protein H257_08301 [Aphanomyces astaci]|eukprot:XP_009832432.1 hypothetical protein H257_08301 [Aphanomyces astaci]